MSVYEYVCVYVCVHRIVLARTVKCNESSGIVLILNSPSHRIGQGEEAAH